MDEVPELITGYLPIAINLLKSQSKQESKVLKRDLKNDLRCTFVKDTDDNSDNEEESNGIDKEEDEDEEYLNEDKEYHVELEVFIKR